MIGSIISTKKIPTTHLKQRITHEKFENEKNVIDKKIALVKVNNGGGHRTRRLGCRTMGKADDGGGHRTRENFGDKEYD
jgi:hypothetical protein